ncbi:MAG: hypothetical protein IGR92_18815 [Leptolyngbyaceae cyanobacterium T60_A2020_046]|nr:hypothetical protein [Leptolyngbyaceae cyanobacterium T60_A2020_046]
MQLPSDREPRDLSVLWLCLWFVLGLGLRLTHLALKPAWMDEVSTVIFSLGNSTYELGLDRVLSLQEALRPLTIDPSATVGDTIRYLLAENNHPPLYFAIAHLWSDWFAPHAGLESLAVARSLSALCGALAIPLAFWVGRVAFQSSMAGLLAAAFMAVSPLGVFLSQEARHYGLAIALVTASLGCFAIAAQQVWQSRSPTWRLVLGWLGINGLAFANHYFSMLTFGGEAVVLGAIAAWQVRQDGAAVLWKRHWQRIYIAAVGTAIGVLVWAPIVLRFYGSPQSSNLNSDLRSLSAWLNPIIHTLLALIFTVLTPITFFADTPIKVAVVAGSIVVMLAIAAWVTPRLIAGTKAIARDRQGQIGLWIMGGFWLAMLGIFALICYGYGADISRGLRYKFTYYPALVILLGGILAHYWPHCDPAGAASLGIPLTRWRLSGRRFVQIVWVVSLISSLWVVNDLAFSKFYNPDRFVTFVQTHSEDPVVFATASLISRKPTAIGIEILSVAWEIERHFSPTASDSLWQGSPEFLVVRRGYGAQKPPHRMLVEQLSPHPRPFDLWVLNETPDLTAAQCLPDADTPTGNKGSYRYSHYRCR